MTETAQAQTEPALSVAETYAAGLERSETVDGKRVFKEVIEYTGFTLQALLPDLEAGFVLETVEIGEGDKKATVQRVAYGDDKLQYLQDALTAKVQAAARARSMAGNEPATTFAELMESTGGAGQYKKLQKEFKEAIAEFLSGRGVKELQVVAVVKQLDPDALATSTQANKDTIANIINKFLEANPEVGTSHASVIKRIQDAIDVSEDDMDLSGIALG